MKGISKTSQKESTRKLVGKESAVQRHQTNQSEDLNINLEILKEALLLQRSHILNQASEFRLQQICPTDVLKDDSDRVSNDLIQNVSIRLFERDSSSLMAIDQALGKISAGTYGQCEACGEQIPTGRLKARPFASMCICCMEDQENHKNSLF